MTAASRKGRACTAMLLAGAFVALAGCSSESEPLAVAGSAKAANLTQCVEPTEFMRRNHMELLKHQRDETTLKGVRSERYSLKECLSCHVVYGADATPVTTASPAHFCRSCHDYAAVSIDCFQCHASRPEAAELPADHQFSKVYPGIASVNGSE